MRGMAGPYNLERFVLQQVDIYPSALAELRAGKKRTHWMWFVFPQLRGLGHSPAAVHYGISSIDEARAYLDHPMLGPNLREAVEALLPWAGMRTAEQMFGTIDAMKLCSCLTLFDAVEPGGVFTVALDRLYAGGRDERTLALLNAAQ
jgi:uncharacterized protein (DUF1810 family)